MKDGLFIFSENSNFYYDFFAQFAFWVSFLVLMAYAWYKKYPMVEWLAIVLSGRMGFLIGSRIGGFSAADWSLWLQSGQMPIEHSQSIWGGLLLGLGGILLTRRMLHFSLPVFSLYAIAVPLGLAVQRLGCLIAGCCFGTPTHLPFGLQYGIYSPAFSHHSHMGLLEGIADRSLAIHPVPIYFILAYLLTAVLVIRFKDHFRKDTAVAYFAFATLALARFFVEFFRDASTNPGLQGELWLYLKNIQWFSLIFFLICLGLIFIQSRRFVSLLNPSPHSPFPFQGQQPSYKNQRLASRESHLKGTVNVRGGSKTQKNLLYSQSNHPPFTKWLILFSIWGLSFYVFRDQFSELDMWAIFCAMLALSLAQFIRWYKQAPAPVLRWSTAFLVLAGTSWMAQVVDQDSLRAVRLAEKENLPSHWGGIRAGFGIGNYETEYRDCDGRLTERNIHSFRTGGIGYTHYLNLPKYMRAEFGLNLGLGHDRNERSSFRMGGTSGTINTSLWAVGAYARYDFRWVGLGVGGYTGKMIFFDSPENLTLQTYVRLGPYDIFYLDGGTMRQFPHALSGTSFQIGIGSGMGRMNGTEVRVGLSANGGADGTAGYVNARIPYKGIIWSPYLSIGDNTSIGLNVEYSLIKRKR